MNLSLLLFLIGLLGFIINRKNIILMIKRSKLYCHYPYYNWHTVYLILTISKDNLQPTSANPCYLLLVQKGKIIIIINYNILFLIDYTK